MPSFNSENAHWVGLSILEEMMDREVNDYTLSVSMEVKNMSFCPPVGLEGQQCKILVITP